MDWWRLWELRYSSNSRKEKIEKEKKKSININTKELSIYEYVSPYEIKRRIKYEIIKETLNWKVTEGCHTDKQNSKSISISYEPLRILSSQN